MTPDDVPIKIQSNDSKTPQDPNKSNVNSNQVESHIPDGKFMDVMTTGYKEEPLVSKYEQRRQKRLKKKQLLMTARQIKRILRKRPINKINLAYQAYFFLVSIVVLVLSIIAYRDMEYYPDQFDQFLKNWQQDTLVDIQYTYTSYRCDDLGPDYSPLYEYTWPGTYQGCDCTKNTAVETANASSTMISQFFKKYFQINQVCSQDEQKQGCTTVDQELPKIFSSWSKGLDGKPFTLCGKRDKYSNYVNNSRLVCKTNEIQCGSGNTQFCMTGQKCPITEIGFTTNSNYQNLSISNNTNIGGLFEVGPQYYFYYLRNTSTMPISEVRVTEGDSVCLLNNESNISPGRDDYPLMRTQRINCNDRSDSRFQKINQIPEDIFYLANNIQYLEISLPYYQINPSYNWTMFVKPYIYWKQSCKGQLQDDVVYVGNTISWIYIVLRVLLGFTITYFTIMGIIFNTIGVLTALNFAWSCMISTFLYLLKIKKAKPEHQFNVIFLIELIAKVIFQVMEIIVICIAFAIIQIRREVIVNVNNQDCTDDPITRQMFISLEESLTSQVWSYNLGILVLFCLTLFIDIYSIKKALDHGHHHGAKKHKEHHKLINKDDSNKESQIKSFTPDEQENKKPTEK